MNTTIDRGNTQDALTLLSAALDSSGYIVIRGFGVGAAKDKQPRQRFFAPGDYQGACAEAVRLSNAGYDTYFATSTFLSNKSAEATNVNAVKCFKIDLDVEEGNSSKYATKKEAVTAMLEFCSKHGLPVPAMLDSGFGCHTYWCLTESLDASDGKLYSEKLKSLLIAYGLKHDRTVTGDIARVLRVPDTLNNKNPAVSRRVKLKTPVTLVDTDALLDRIDAMYEATPNLPSAAPQPELLLGALPAHLRGVQLDKDTIGLISGKPKSFAVLIKRSIAGRGCAQLLNINDKQSKQTEDRWRAGLSIAHFCEDGEQAIHDMSSRDKRYDHDATVKKAQLIKGPYKCATFESNWPELCTDCPHKGKITSPIQLGTVDDGNEKGGTALMPIEEATEAIRQAEERAKAGDCGAPFELKSIAALQALRKNDAAEYQRMRNALKKANRDVSLAELDALVTGAAGVTESKDQSAADALVSLARERCTFFHDSDDVAYAAFQRDGHRECWPLYSESFSKWLSYQFYRSCGIAPAELAMTTALSTLSGQAKFEGEELSVAVRVAKHGSDYYIDLCDDEWKALRVTSAGWQVIDTPPIMFVRTSAMRPLPTPVRDGRIDDLWQFANVASEDRGLVLAWMIETYRPDTPYPVLELCGEQGSAKSSTQSVLRDLIDPNKAQLRAKPKTLDDLFVSARVSHVTSLENLSFLQPDWQDALCALATGAGYGGRQLYTNADECVYEVKRPILMNGISVVATRQDLMDRTLLVSLPTIANRRSEVEVHAEFERAKAGIFGALLTLFSQSLGILPHVQIAPAALPRMADFAFIGEAVFRALGRPDGEFLTKYQEKRRYGIAQTIESSPVAAALMTWLDKNPAGHTGPLKQLYELLAIYRPSGDQWPRSLHAFGDSLRRISPALRMIGINARHIGHQRDGHHWEIKGDIYLPT